MYNEASAAQPAFMDTEIIDTTKRDDTDRRACRWIVFAGDRMPPEQKRTFDGMGLGGEVLGHDFKTLAPTKGLLRRCQITPMIVGHDDLNDHSIGVGQGGDTSQYRRRDHFNAEARQMEAVYFNECLPGDELAGLFTANQGVFDYGIREVEVLRGVEFKEPEARERVEQYQRSIFPDWDGYLTGRKEFFKTTEELRQYLIDRSSEVDSTVKAIIGTLLESLSQFERWATRQLDNHSRLVKAPPTAEGRVHGWESIHHQYFDVLELNKDAFLMKKADDSPARESDSPSREEFNEMRQMFSAVMPALGKLAEITVANQSGVKSEKRVCGATKPDNSPCKAFVKGDSDFCANHQEVDVNA